MKARKDLTRNMKITASIVTYNSGSEVLTAIGSLLSAGLHPEDIYVVDNASTDNTVSLIKEKYSGINVKMMEKNIGFGAAHNTVIKSVDSDIHIMVNPDIIVDRENIEKLASYMKTHADVVLLTPKVMNTDGTEQYLPKQYPDFRYLACSFLENKGECFRKVRDEFILKGRNITEPIEINMCTGCFMFTRTSALQKVGGFDDRYFLYMEDSDLTREMQKLGKTVYLPSAQVTHAWHRDSAKLSKAMVWHIESAFKYLWKWRNDKCRRPKV